MAAVLTKRSIGKFDREGPDGFLWDDDVRGLAVRRQRGTTTWIVRYRVAGKSRQFTLGRWPELSIDDARTKAKRRIGEAAHDRDPHAELRGTSVAGLLDHFEKHHRTRVHGDLPRADRNTRARLDVLRESWGTRKASTIRYTDVAELLATVNGPYSQNRMRALIRSIWNRGRAWNLIPATVANPAEGVSANPEHTRTVRALTPDELARVLEAAHPKGPPGMVICLCVFTAARPSEVLALRWADVDLDAKTVVFRGRAGKGRKAGDMMVQALGPAAAIGLSALPRTDSPWVFPSRRGKGPLTTVRETWDEVVKEAKLPPGTRIYDLRAAMITAIERSVGLQGARIYAGHTDARTTLKYVRPAEEQRREAAAAGELAIGDAIRARAKKGRA